MPLSPSAVTPTKLPSMRVLCAPPSMMMPSLRSPEMMLRSAVSVPPMSVSGASRRMPSLVLPRARNPVGSVPIRFVCTSAPTAGVPVIRRPAWVLPEMMLPAPGAPTTAAEALESRMPPVLLPRSTGPKLVESVAM